MKKKLLILVFMAMLFPYRVFALNELTITCDSDVVTSNKNVKCEIKGNADENIIAVSSSVSVSDNLIISSFDVSDPWIDLDDKNDSDNTSIEVFSDNEVKGEFTLGTLYVKAKDGKVDTNESVTLKESNFQKETDEDNEISIQNTSVNLTTILASDKYDEPDDEDDEKNVADDEINDNKKTGSSIIYVISIIGIISLVMVLYFVKKKNK